MGAALDAKTLLRDAVLILKAAAIDSPGVDARMLLQFVTGATREDLLRDPNRCFSDDEIKHFKSLITRRADREPVSHLIGQREFWGLSFAVTSDVLDPRPDSETLIEIVLSQLDDRNKHFRILDLGVGSGCLLLTLLHELPNAWGLGIDLSEAAITVAQGNAVGLDLHHRATFCRARWAAPLAASFDIVVSNPPYIIEKEIADLAPEVKRHEPYLALSGGDDGLQAYRQLAPEISGLLNQGGYLAVECGAGQWVDVAAILATPELRAQDPVFDLGGVARVFVAQAANCDGHQEINKKTVGIGRIGR